MPLYTYRCSDEDCSHEQEELLTAKEKETAKIQCEECGEFCFCIPSAPVIGSESFKPGVILDNGRKVQGYFGKSARKK